MKDLLGIKPVAKALDRTVEASLKGAGELLSRLCLPAAEEVGLWARDRIAQWRLRNLASVMEKARKQMPAGDWKLHPRVGIRLIEAASEEDDDEVQEMWAGMFGSSLSADGSDESGLLFVTILKQMSKVECRLLKHVCEQADLLVTEANWAAPANTYVVATEELLGAAQIDDIHRLDRELDHMRSLDLFEDPSGFDLFGDIKHVKARISALGLALYARCRGWRGPTVEYYRKCGRFKAEVKDAGKAEV